MKWLVACLLCWPLLASAATYNLSLGQRPPCSTSWSVSGTVYTCTGNGRVTLGGGDLLIANSAVTVRANNGFELNNSNVGTAQNTVSLQSDYGSVLVRNSTLYGSITASSGNFEFTDTSVVGALTTGSNIVISGGSFNGNVQSQSNTVRITGATIQGSITANSGAITLTDSSVVGAIQTNCCTVTATNSQLTGNIRALSGMTFNGGSIEGDLTMLGFNPLTMTGVSYLAGEASGASTATITNSQVGSASQTINITTTSGAITFSNSIAYGIYQAPGYSTINVQNNSQIYGQCLPNSTPANACSAMPPPPIDIVLNHIRLLHPEVSCLDASLQLTACLNNDCSATLSDSIEVSLESSVGSFSGSQVTLVEDSKATINFIQGKARVNLHSLQSAEASISVQGDIIPLQCFFADGLSSDCTISFTKAGLTFIRPVPDNTTYAGLDYSGQLSSQCGVRVSGTKSVQLGVQCVNPQACISGQQFTVNGVSIAANPAGQTASRTAIPLTFNAQGVADFNFRYTDVGELRLYANLVLPAEPDAPALTLMAESSPFVVKPHTIQFVEAAQLPYRANSNPGTRQSGVGFWSAGKPFRVLAQAQNAQGNITPNFGNELTRQRLALALHELVYPAAGVAEPSLLEFGEFQPATVAGRQQSDTVVWHEAGTIRLQAKLANQDYLGAGDAFATSVSSDVGRFYPDRFRLQNALTQNSCNSVTYMGQPAISLSYLLHAEGYTGRVLQNYDTSLYLGTAQFSVVASNTEVANPALSLGSRLSVNQSSWLQGRYQVSQTDAAFSRQASQQPDGPFNALQLGLQLVSEIDNRPLSDLNFNAASSGNCGTNCTAVRLADPLALRYGRLLLENAFGSELEPLPLKLVAEYWNGQMFVTNTADNCTVISPANLQKTDGELTPVIAGDGGVLLNGVSSPVSLFLQAPGQTGAVTYQYLSPAWLRFNWDNSNDYSQHARNEVLFGRYRGNSRLIFWREQ